MSTLVPSKIYSYQGAAVVSAQHRDAQPRRHLVVLRAPRPLHSLALLELSEDCEDAPNKSRAHANGSFSMIPPLSHEIFSRFKVGAIYAESSYFYDGDTYLLLHIEREFRKIWVLNMQSSAVFQSYIAEFSGASPWLSSLKEVKNQ